MKLKPPFEKFSGFISATPGIFLFRDGKEVCYWDTSHMDPTDIRQMAEAFLMYIHGGAEAADEYCNKQRPYIEKGPKL